MDADDIGVGNLQLKILLAVSGGNRQSRLLGRM
jgi:hypothetical protein